MRAVSVRLALLVIAAAGLLIVPVATGYQKASAQVPRAFAGIVVDAKTGKPLYESSADAARYPASVVKVMTLYVLFQELEAGNIRLSDQMKVSSHAAAAVPTKLGLSAGQRITVENGIKALVTLSANDIARVIAEHISGTEAKFAERMTATARALGMNKTTYRNASGLPDRGQVTTVRDQSILGIAIYQHFPKYYEYFQTRSFTYGKRTYGNHNRLLGENGVDGIKTGFINAAGFNLLTAARRDNRHIVVVAFGFDKSASRDARVRQLVREYLPKARSGSYLASVPVPGRRGAVAGIAPVPVTPMPYPEFRLAAAQPAQIATFRPDPAAVARQLEEPLVGARETAQQPTIPVPAEPTAVAAVNTLAAPSSAQQEPPVDVIGAWLSENLQLGAPAAPLGHTRPSTPLVPPVGIGDDGTAVDPMPSGSINAAPPTIEVAAAAPVTSQPTQTGRWVVQIGATPTETGAASLLSSAKGTVSALADFEPYVERFVNNGQVFFRARFGGFGDRGAATAMCNQLKKAKMSCLAMQS